MFHLPCSPPYHGFREGVEGSHPIAARRGDHGRHEPDREMKCGNALDCWCQLCLPSLPGPARGSRQAMAGLGALSGLRLAVLAPRAAHPTPVKKAVGRPSAPGSARPGAWANRDTHRACPDGQTVGASRHTIEFLERIAPDRLHGLVCVGLSPARGLLRSKLSQPGHLRDLDGGFLHPPFEDTAPSLNCRGGPAGERFGAIDLVLPAAIGWLGSVRVEECQLRAWPRWA